MTYKVTMLGRQRLDCDGCGIAEVDFEGLASHVASAIHDGAPGPGWTTEMVDGIRMDYCGKCSVTAAENVRLRRMVDLYKQQAKTFQNALRTVVLEANEVEMAKLEAMGMLEATDNAPSITTQVQLLPAGAVARPPLMALLVRDSIQTLMVSVATLRAQGYSFSTSSHVQLDTAASVTTALQHDGTVWIVGPGQVPKYQGILTMKGKVSGG